MKITKGIISIGLLFAANAFACGGGATCVETVYYTPADGCNLVDGQYVTNFSIYPDINGIQMQCHYGRWEIYDSRVTVALGASCTLVDGRLAPDGSTVPDENGNPAYCSNGQWLY